ncbi:hypothetical protein B0H16DRAFT_53155 [Mycena metata]|uniref:Uncharacterized protein n=1 Tax=Mycena metata TaxID=1033252 RepID=A0AAD7IDV6_9AGAR|nr:hypothetical protein B0H16DRAFT_53155 [Mycena metata]
MRAHRPPRRLRGTAPGCDPRRDQRGALLRRLCGGEDFVNRYIDGHDYMWAQSTMRARSGVVAHPRALPPPPARVPPRQAAEAQGRGGGSGTKEVTQSTSMSSKHTKSAFEPLHPSVTCLRHPDHIGAKDWWLTPKLYLRRPPAYHPEWRLDRLLEEGGGRLRFSHGVRLWDVRVTIRAALAAP